MANTVRTISELLDIFADNTSQDISPQDMRDFVVSTKLDDVVIIEDLADIAFSGSYNDLTDLPNLSLKQDVVSGVSDTEIGYLDGVTSAIQTQFTTLNNSIPTNVSQLVNDAGFITADDIPPIPTLTSELTNDSGFVTEVPTLTSELTNDSGFVTEVPTLTSELTNDSGFINLGDLALVASSGSYNDLSETPNLTYLPTQYVNDGSDPSFHSLHVNSMQADTSIDCALISSLELKNEDDSFHVDGSGNVTALSFSGDGSALTNLPGGSISTDTLTSSSSVAIDFGSANNAKLSIAHNVTFTTSNKAADKTKLLTIFGHASNSYNVTFPSSWKKTANQTLPASIAANSTHQFRLTVFGTSETDVVCEYVSGAGTAVAFTVPASLECYKGSSTNFTATNISGGPTMGQCPIYMVCNIGCFIPYTTYGYLADFVNDPDYGAGTYTSITLPTPTSGIETVLGNSNTFNAPYDGSAGGTGSITYVVGEGDFAVSKNIPIFIIGDDEIQIWSIGSTPVGRLTITVPDGSSTGECNINAADISVALAAKMGADAPSVSWDGSNISFVFSNGSLAHTDVAEMVAVPSSVMPYNNNEYYYTVGLNKTQTGDGDTLSDTYDMTFQNAAVGWFDFGSSLIITRMPDGSVSPSNLVISGVQYLIDDIDPGTIRLTATNTNDNGTLTTPSATIGTFLEAVIYESVKGNT